MEKQTYHFIGICGASMSALAIWLKTNGHNVQGSDICLGENSKQLESYGIKVFCGHNKNNIKGCDIVVYSSAIKNNVELNFAKQQNILILTRAQLLNMIAKHYQIVIAVSGAHGKTTTTALVYNCLKIANQNPTLHLGGVIKGETSGMVVGDKKYFVTEACEYCNNFLSLSPDIGVVLNIEKEHLDFFKTYKNIKTSFQKFQNNCKIVVCESKTNYSKNNNTITFGSKNSDFYAKNIKCHSNGCYGFDCYKQKQFYHHFDLAVVGKHNVKNALAVVAVCDKLGLEKQHIYQGLSKFQGIKRRYENLGNKNVFLVHDYAHHPTEIKKAIEITKKITNKPVLVVFQPHTYSRTKTLINQFKSVFCGLDDVIVLKTYSAREKYDKQGSAKTLYENIKSANKHSKYCANFDVCQTYIQNKIKDGYAVVMLGAGNINEMAENLSKYVDKCF